MPLQHFFLFPFPSFIKLPLFHPLHFLAFVLTIFLPLVVGAGRGKQKAKKHLYGCSTAGWSQPTILIYLLSYKVYTTTEQGDEKEKGQYISFKGHNRFMIFFFLQSSLPFNSLQVSELKTTIPLQLQNYLLHNRCQPPKGQATLISSSHNSTTQLHYNPLCMLQLTAVCK